MEQITTAAAPAPDDGAPRREDGVIYRSFARSWLPGLGGFHYSRPLARFVREEVSRFDVVHVEGLFQYTTVAACRAAWRAGVPYVIGPLGALNAWSIRHKAWKKRPYHRLVDAPLLARAAALHANSEVEADALAALGYGARVHLIPLGVDPPSPRPERRRGGDAIHVVFLSRLHPVKGLPLLLEALRAVRDSGLPARLTIAGSAGAGEAGYDRTLREMADRLGLADAVRFVGHIEGTAKDALLRDADVFALTSYQESFGIAVAEAMAYRLPVLITEAVGIAREVREAGAGHVVRADRDEIERALRGLAGDPAGRIAMGERGARLVAERYSWGETGRRLLALYEEVARRPSPRARPIPVPAG